jgi:hypothetical protein
MNKYVKRKKVQHGKTVQLKKDVKQGPDREKSEFTQKT